MLGKISKAIGCEIPTELVLAPGRRGPRTKTPEDAPAFSVMAQLSDESMADLEKIKKLSGICADTEAVKKAFHLVQLLLEKQGDGYAIYLHKDKDVIEFQFLF
jgi:hypothetical protein